MTTEAHQMIQELVRMVEQELGAALPPDSAHRLEAALCRAYGGERVYVPKLPKLVAQVRVAALGTGSSSAEIGRAIGISARHVRRIVRGR